jgi:hypothetical protein
MIGVYPCPKVWYKADWFAFDDHPMKAWHTCPQKYRDERGYYYAKCADCFACCRVRGEVFKWRSSVTMPRQLARYTPTVRTVRVEQANGEWWWVCEVK